MLQNIFSAYEMHSALVVKSKEPYINSAATNYRHSVRVLQHVGFCCARFVCCCFLTESQMKDFLSCDTRRVSIRIRMFIKRRENSIIITDEETLDKSPFTKLET